MRFEIVLSPDAAKQLQVLRGAERSAVVAALETFLRHAPSKESKSRIKRLRGLKQPEYRLRVDQIRIYYDIVDSEVQILAVVPKAGSYRWLDEKGVGL
jgi:mRNA interferase RelE/StbE